MLKSITRNKMASLRLKSQLTSGGRTMALSLRRYGPRRPAEDSRRHGTKAQAGLPHHDNPAIPAHSVGTHRRIKPKRKVSGRAVKLACCKSEYHSQTG
jgi:hypothetical protein